MLYVVGETYIFLAYHLSSFFSMLVDVQAVVKFHSLGTFGREGGFAKNSYVFPTGELTNHHKSCGKTQWKFLGI